MIWACTSSKPIVSALGDTKWPDDERAQRPSIEIREVSGSMTPGPASVPVTVRPMEVQVMRG